MPGRVVLLHSTASSGKTTIGASHYDVTVGTSRESPEDGARAILTTLALRRPYDTRGYSG